MCLHGQTVAGEYIVALPAAVTSADVVAEVELVSGSEIKSTDGFPCGATYTAHVISAIKGTAEGDILTFGHYTGHSIGLRYFVFLTQMRDRGNASSNAEVLTGNIASLDRESRSKCESLWPGYRETYGGLGTIPVIHGDRVSYREAVRLRRVFYQFPSSLRAVYEDDYPHGPTDPPSGDAQVEVSDFVDFLARASSGSKERLDPP